MPLLAFRVWRRRSVLLIRNVRGTLPMIGSSRVPKSTLDHLEFCQSPPPGRVGKKWMDADMQSWKQIKLVSPCYLSLT